jgi:hypothetical protein
MTQVPAKRGRGRPPISQQAGKRSMVHLPKELDERLRAAGGGSLSLGIIRHVARLPPLLTTTRAKARKLAALRAAKLTRETS